MPFNGVGVFQRVYQWVQDAANGIFVDATRTDTDSNDIAAGLTNCVTRDGQSPWIANIPSGGFKITGLPNGSATGDSVNYGQVFNSPAFVTPTSTTSPPNGDNSLRLATTAFAQQLAFQTALPAQSLGFLASNGTVAAFSRTFSGYAVDESKSANVASAATIDLSNTVITGNLVHVTGTNNISAITVPSGAERTIVFDGVLTLVNSATLILPSNANITTAVGDTMRVRGDGAAARVVSYETFNGRALVVTPPALVLLATVNISASANIDFLNVFNSTYDDYEIIVDGATIAAAQNLSIRMAVAGVVDSSAQYAFCPLEDSTTGIGSQTSVQLQVSVSSQPVMSNIRINSANSPVQYVTAISIASAAIGTPPTSRGVVGFHSLGTASGFRLFWGGGGSFTASGTVKVYGISKV